MKRALLPICILTAAALLIVPASVVAKPPAKGKYECVIGSTYFGEVTIKSASRYKRNGRIGKYSAGSKLVKFDDGRKGYKLTFKTGGFKGYKGRWYKASDGTYEIALRNPIDDFESIYCDK
jgi:hypothetical protein